MTLPWNIRRTAITRGEIMAFTKIDEEIILHGGVTPLPDSPQLQPAALKEKFDEKGNAACVAFNNLIDEISAAVTGARNIGAEVPSDVSASANLQSVINALALMAVAADNDRHTHTNKTTLDDITSEWVSTIGDLLTLMSSVESIATTTMTSTSQTELPTSKAVASYFTGQMNTIKGAIYPVGAVVWTDGTDPLTVYGVGTWQQVETTENLTAWKRVS